MIKIYNKLVRDKIPKIIAKQGKYAKTRILGEQEYRQELIRKLTEEATEFQNEPSLEELADIQEVILGLLDSLGKSPAELEAIRTEKAAERGAFKDKIFLIEAEE